MYGQKTNLGSRFLILAISVLLTTAFSCQEPTRPTVTAKSPRKIEKPPSGHPPKQVEKPVQQPMKIVEEPHPPRQVESIESVPQPPVGETKTVVPEAKIQTPTPSKPKPTPKRPKGTWVIFREAFDEAEDAACTAEWVGKNRFEIKTKNIQRLTIDMNRRPEGAPGKGPWIFFVDGQGIELTGFKPKKPGYTGRKKDLVRSKNGKWTVDRRKLYRIGA